MHTISGFKSERLRILKLNCVHAIVLDWFVYFAHSGKQLILKTENKKIHYYWVKYSKAFADIPLPFSSTYKLSKCLDELAGKNHTHEKHFPLIRKTFASKHGNQIGLAIRENVLAWLRGTEDAEMPTGFTSELGIKSKKITIQKRSTKLNSNCLEIIYELKQLQINDKPLFKNEQPQDEWHYTKGLQLFQMQLLSLYEGRFNTDYMMKIEKWFIDKYSYYISANNKKTIRACKGSWIKIKEIILKSANNYISWFASISEVTDKTKLPRTLQEWIFSPHNQTSMFYICVDKAPTVLREASTEKLYNKIPFAMRAQKLMNPNWDGMSFWKKIYSLHKWYVVNHNELLEKDSNCVYWLESEKTFIDSWFAWIETVIGIPSINNLGTNNKTWDWYVKDMLKKYAISYDIFN